MNTYNYAENEPIAHIDLHGLQKWKSEILNAFPETDEEWRQGVSQGQSPKEVSNNQGGDETSFFDGIRDGLADAFKSFGSMLETGEVTNEDFFDKGKVGHVGVAQFSSGNHKNANTLATPEAEGGVVQIIEGLEELTGYISGSGAPRPTHAPFVLVGNIENVVEGIDKGKKAIEEFNNNEQSQEKREVKWSDEKTIIYKPYRPNED